MDDQGRVVRASDKSEAGGVLRKVQKFMIMGGDSEKYSGKTGIFPAKRSFLPDFFFENYYMDVKQGGQAVL